MQFRSRWVAWHPRSLLHWVPSFSQKLFHDNPKIDVKLFLSLSGYRTWPRLVGLDADTARRVILEDDPSLKGTKCPFYTMADEAAKHELTVPLQQQPRQDKKFTARVFIACLIAATGGLMFGYVIGVSGGVSSMKDFLQKFFPSVIAEHGSGHNNGNYCRYSNQMLQLFTSSTYIVGLISTFGASQTTRALGRKPTMLVAGIFYLIGTALNAGANSLLVLIIGRVFLGCGIGFGNQAAPLYLSEVAPPHLRGGLNILFQLNVTTGIFIANLVNYVTENIHPWGWRLSFAVAGVPAIMLTLGSFVLSETPNSLIERGYISEGKAILQKIRGTEDVEEEFNELVEVGIVSSGIKHPFRDLFTRRNMPPLIIAIALQFFQQFTGINSIMFYSPVLFETVGFGSNASLFSTVFTGIINVCCTIISIFVVDKFGRRFLLLEAGVQLFIAQVVIGVIMGVGLKDTVNLLGEGQAYTVVTMVCLFVCGFAWSWGPLGWLVASEIFPLEVRSAGQSITVCTNLFFTFAIAQGFLSMLCVLKYGIFLLFAGFLIIMTLFVALLLPETKGIPIEEMSTVWKKHWLWKRFV